MPLDLGLVIGETGPVGPTGATGATGTSLTILGIYNSKEELIAEHPTGTTGETYLINGHYFLWDTRTSEWTDLGPYRGPVGYSPSFYIREDGHLIASYPDEAEL